MRREVGKYVFIFGTSSTNRKFSMKCQKHCLLRTVNNWNNKFKAGSNGVVLKQTGRPNVMNDPLIRKVNETQLELGKMAARLKEDQL